VLMALGAKHHIHENALCLEKVVECLIDRGASSNLNVILNVVSNGGNKLSCTPLFKRL
jgi:hypothetical protein